MRVRQAWHSHSGAVSGRTSSTRQAGSAAALPWLTQRASVIALATSIGCGWLLLEAHAADDAPPAAKRVADEGVTFFEKRIRPLFVERCHKCHGPEKQTSGLRLDTRAGILDGGEHGPAVVPGKPEESLLIT